MNPDSLAAWEFDLFWQKLPLDDAAIALLPEGVDLPQTPALVQADDGSPEVWLVDGDYRRHVPDPTALAAWGFSFGDVQSTSATEVNALTLGPPLRSTPVLVRSSNGKVDLVDDPFDTGGGGTSGTGGTGGGVSASGGKTGSGGAKSDSAQHTSLSDEDGGCSISGRSSAPVGLSFWLGLGLAIGLTRRNRRSAT